MHPLVRPAPARLLLAFGLVGSSALVAPLPAVSQSAEAEVEGVVRDLFRHMKAGDAEAMRALLHPVARLVTTSRPDGSTGARTVPVASWLDGVARGERELDERLYDLEVRVSGPLAVVWTGYSLFVDGVLSHCGVDLVDLARTPEGWRIVQIADTREREGCPTS